MKRILIANDLLKGGGVENVLENLVRYLLKTGNEVTLMIPNCSEQEAQALFGKEIKVFPTVRSLKYIKKFTPQWFWDRGYYILQKQLHRISLSHQKYDVVIALKEGPTMQSLANVSAHKKFAWIHTDFRYMHWTKGCFSSKKQERKCMQKFDKVVCVSQATVDSVVETIGDPGNLCIRYNPINCFDILDKSKELCNQKKETNSLLFVSVGRLVNQKNYSLLLDVCSELEKKYDFELWILGEGINRQELEGKIQQKRIKSVTLMGNHNNPFRYMRIADVFVSVAIWESYGLAIQESLILGIPVITTECPAIKEVFDTRFGQLVENSYESLYHAMETFILNPELLRGYKNNIEKYYDIKDLYEKRLRDICSLWGDEV